MLYTLTHKPLKNCEWCLNNHVSSNGFMLIIFYSCSSVRSQKASRTEKRATGRKEENLNKVAWWTQASSYLVLGEPHKNPCLEAMSCLFFCCLHLVRKAGRQGQLGRGGETVVKAQPCNQQIPVPPFKITLSDGSVFDQYDSRSYECFRPGAVPRKSSTTLDAHSYRRRIVMHLY